MNNVLFISPDFYSYTRLVINTAEKMGLKITFFDCRPKVTSFQKWKMKKSPAFRKRIIDEYINEILEKTKNINFRLIVLNSTVFFDERQVLQILKASPEANKVFAMWDSTLNYPSVVPLFGLFERKYSFEKSDCVRYGLTYLPLFYDPSCLSIDKSVSAPSSDIIFIGSAYPKRYQEFCDLQREMNKKEISCYFYFYFRSRGTYLFQKAKNKELKHSKFSDFHYVPLAQKEKNALTAASKSVLDMHYGNQAGLSLRTVEAVAMKKKLITLSKDIVNYDVYDPANVAIISGNDYSQVTKDFLDSPYKEPSIDFQKEFSVETYVKSLFIKNL